MKYLTVLGSVGTLLYLQVPTILAQALTQCPVTETVGTTANGFKSRLCPGTDYQGPSAQIIGNVNSPTACIQLCANDMQCVRMVWDTTSNTCHLKATDATLTWVADNRWNSAQLDTIVGRTVINKCPYTESTTTGSNGIKYQVCAGTDYEGRSLQIVQNIASNTDCIQLCVNTDGCTKTVFDNVAMVCHIKDDSGNLIWSTNRRFTASRRPTTLSPATSGQWSDLIKLPVIPVAGYMVPQAPDSSRLLLFSSYGVNNFGGPHGYTQFADYNYKTGAVSQRTVSNTQHDMFCPGISALSDGRIVITGGSDAAVTSIYNPATNAFVRGPDMNIARGYQTSATLSNGKIFTIGGSYSGGIGGKTGEVFDPSTNAWTVLPGADVKPMLTTFDAEGDWRTDNHGWLFGWKNGAVFQAGPSREMHWYSTTGNGGVTSAGIRDTDSDAMCGINVMYDTGKIFTAAGTQSYTNSPALARSFLITLNNPNEIPTLERGPDLNYPRAFANAVVLPDGTVLVTGGQPYARVFTDTDGILVPELYNPATKAFTKLASASIPRNYHSISLLLPDATVFTGGGGLCYNPNGDGQCDRSVDHSDGEIFSPPYLFKADGTPATRPVISSVSANSIRVGGTLTVRMNDSTGATFSLIRMGSATHSVNSDQRRISLINVRQSGSKYTATLPSDSGVLIPGFYYLFAVSKGGVPSVAKTVQITI